MQEKVDIELKKIVDECHKDAIELIRKNRRMLDKVVVILLKKETLNKDDFEKIVGKKTSKKSSK